MENLVGYGIGGAAAEHEHTFITNYCLLVSHMKKLEGIKLLIIYAH